MTGPVDVTTSSAEIYATGGALEGGKNHYDGRKP